MTETRSNPVRPLRRAVLCALATLAALALLLPAPAQAQFRVLAGAGLYTPLDDLGEVRSSGGQVLVDAGRRNASVALGLALERGDPDGFASIRLGVALGTTSEVPIDAVECQDCALRSHVLAVTAAAVLRPIPRLGPVQPYVVAGGGFKRYDFDRNDFESSFFLEGFRTQSQPAVQVGSGVQFTVGGFRPIVELSAYLSRYEVQPSGSRTGTDDIQTDLFFTVALPFGGGG
jgi:hypothetical protein